jgi:xanthine dehydrogenase YagR molybdenum-binding subunit
MMEWRLPCRIGDASTLSAAAPATFAASMAERMSSLRSHRRKQKKAIHPPERIIKLRNVPPHAHERNRGTDRSVSCRSYDAVFAGVAVDPDVGTIRVRRATGAYGIGCVVNPRLAHSQCIGGMIGGIGMALMERTVLDGRDGRPVNAHMVDYLMPVNVDIPELEAFFVDEVDPHVNPLGVKGLGEIALVGMASAIVNAVFHATNKRVRSCRSGSRTC